MVFAHARACGSHAQLHPDSPSIHTLTLAALEPPPHRYGLDLGAHSPGAGTPAAQQGSRSAFSEDTKGYDDTGVW